MHNDGFSNLYDLTFYPNFQYTVVGINIKSKLKVIELPIPAVFVVNESSKIIYKFADANYMNKINIDELLKTL